MQGSRNFSAFAGQRRRLLRAGAGAGALLAVPAIAPSVAQQIAPLAEVCRTQQFETALPTGTAGDYARLTRLQSGAILRAVTAPALSAPDAPRLSAGYQTGQRINPVLVVDAQYEVSVDLTNALDSRVTSWHWHGVALPEADDGVFALAQPGATRRVTLKLPARGGTMWLHPHPHGQTAQQTFEGLACPLIVRDAVERALAKRLELELGRNDVVLMLQDARYGNDGRVVYAPRAGEPYEGVFGACITVNGVDAPVWNAPPGWLRLRIVNAANARLFKLGVRQGGQWHPLWLIGTDQGLLPAAVTQRHVFLAPGQRIDVLLDARAWQPDVPVFLASDTFDPMHGTARAHEKSGLPHGSAVALMQIRAATTPARLPELPKVLDERAVWQGTLPTADRDFTLTTTGALWRMNGKTYKAEEVPIEVARGAREVWSLNNSQRGMPHPMHVHGFAFVVLERKDSPEHVRALAIDPQGRLANDLGINDTVVVWPGETVRIGIDFAHTFTQAQRYVVHCHNLEHEDGGLMLNFRVNV
jgi:suppressor of ftsI/bilirubin oxidase